MIPTFAVVGRANEGKSSIISTFTETDSISISPVPGTTTESKKYAWTLQGEHKIYLIDTPGFQEPETAWSLIGREPNPEVLDRPIRVRDFVREQTSKNEFIDECRLLTPILEGAAILYVADMSHPYRESFQAELEILRWTGAPRMAVLNKNGPYEKQWRQALEQYFHFVVNFDAHTPQWEQKKTLLEAMSLIHPPWSQPIKQLLAESQKEHKRNFQKIAQLITQHIVEVGKLQKSFPVESDPEDCLAKFRQDLIHKEDALRQSVEKNLRFRRVQINDDSTRPELTDNDLFSSEVWRAFGLTKTQLAITGTIGGAATAAGIDIALGGHSLGLVSALGGLTAGAAALYGAHQSPEKIAGIKVSGSERVVGPIRGQSFLWLTLDRDLVFCKSLIERTHAMQEPLRIESHVSIVRDLPDLKRAKLSQGLLRAIKKNDSASLELAITEILQDLREKGLEKIT